MPALSPGHRRDAERLHLERAASTRALTQGEDACLAELAFRTHHRGYPLRVRAPARAR